METETLAVFETTRLEILQKYGRPGDLGSIPGK
jgi:hypothetical protein